MGLVSVPEVVEDDKQRNSQLGLLVALDILEVGIGLDGELGKLACEGVICFVVC